MNLQDIRNKVNKMDFQILKLLNTRMELVLKSKKFKEKVEDLKREADVLENIRVQSHGLIAPDFCEKLFEEIISEGKKLQSMDYKLIGFQGEHGAYSEAASRAWNSDIIPMPCGEFTEVFEEVKSGLYDYGIVPVENTLGGVVSRVNELLISTDLFVVGAVKLPIHHCLLALPGTDHRELRAAYSHSQALEQCRNFLARNKLEPVPYYDTAGAAKMLEESTPKASAAIASKLSAKLYNLEIIKENIEDLDTNMTRFLVLSNEESREDGDKCSITFSTEHKSGTLFKVLEVFAKEHINLTRIESIPNRLGSYAFFLDFMGSKKEDRVVKALEEVEKITTTFRFIGCYEEMHNGDTILNY